MKPLFKTIVLIVLLCFAGTAMLAEEAGEEKKQAAVQPAPQAKPQAYVPGQLPNRPVPDVVNAMFASDPKSFRFQQSVHPETGDILVGHNQWVYYREKEGKSFRPVVYGHSMTWMGGETPLRNVLFYVCLPIGHQQQSELWLADLNGSLLKRMGEGTLHINSSPVLSPAGDKMTFYLQPNPITGNTKTSVGWFFLPQSPMEKLEVRYPYTLDSSEAFFTSFLIWKNNNQILFTEMRKKAEGGVSQLTRVLTVGR